MKSVLLSIQPKWCELIASGKKTVEIRKTKPKIETPFKCYIYQTKHREHNGHTYSDGKVIGEFICDEISGGYYVRPFSDTHQKKTCLTYDEIEKYSKGKPLKSWHISDLVIYDKPKELKEFRSPCDSKCDGICEYGCIRIIKRPPQSWCYVEELEDKR